MSNSTVKDSIEYKGTIKVVLKNKDGKIKKQQYHNRGEMPLFTSICRALAGYSIEDYKPKYLMCYSGGPTQENPDQPYEKLLISKVAANGTPLLYKTAGSNLQQNSEDCNIVEYVFTIPVTAFARLGDGLVITKLELWNSRGEEYRVCATVDNINIEIRSTVDTSNILLYWQLKFEAAVNE